MRQMLLHVFWMTTLRLLWGWGEYFLRATQATTARASTHYFFYSRRHLAHSVNWELLSSTDAAITVIIQANKSSWVLIWVQPCCCSYGLFWSYSIWEAAPCLRCCLSNIGNVSAVITFVILLKPRTMPLPSKLGQGFPFGHPFQNLNDAVALKCPCQTLDDVVEWMRTSQEK